MIGSCLALALLMGALEARPCVAASVPPYIAIVEAISGGQVDCVSIVPEGADPHSFSPTLAQCAALEKASLWLLTGEPFEAKCMQLIGKENGVCTLDLRKTSALLPTPCTHQHTRHGPHRQHPFEGMDTHLWLSPQRLISQSRAIAELFSARFPENKTLFEINLEKLIAQLKNLDVRLQQRIARMSHRALLVSHPALTYFCDDYQIEQLSVEFEGRDPTPREQTQLLQDIRIKGVDRVFILKPHPERAAMQLAKHLRLPIIVLDPYARDPQLTLQRLCDGLGV